MWTLEISRMVKNRAAAAAGTLRVTNLWQMEVFGHSSLIFFTICVCCNSFFHSFTVDLEWFNRRVLPLQIRGQTIVSHRVSNERAWCGHSNYYRR